MLAVPLDDSIPTHSSPIRGHVSRKITRTSSLAISTTFSHPSYSLPTNLPSTPRPHHNYHHHNRQAPQAVERTASEGFLQGLEQAYGEADDAVNELDDEELLRLRDMIEALKGKVERRIQNSAGSSL